jgi:hypothetical protein
LLNCGETSGIIVREMTLCAPRVHMIRTLKPKGIPRLLYQ